MNRVARHVIALMLALTLGLHWTVLQSVAWVTMLVNYSAQTSFSEAVAKTFDGHHPCKLCIAVAEGKQSERKNKQLNTFAKGDWILDGETICLIRPPSVPLSPTKMSTPASLISPPLTPPPRLFHG